MRSAFWCHYGGVVFDRRLDGEGSLTFDVDCFLGAREPVALDQKVTEGVAVSRSGSKVAWAIDTRTSPGEVPARTALIYTGDIVEQGGKPVLTNKREAVRLDASDCVGTEPQDFRYGDRELIFVCYTYNTALKAIDGEIRGVDLATGKVVSYLTVADQYDEPEGIYPDGQHILVGAYAT